MKFFKKHKPYKLKHRYFAWLPVYVWHDDMFQAVWLEWIYKEQLQHESDKPIFRYTLN